MKVVFDFSVYSFLGCNIKKELKNRNVKRVYGSFKGANI